MHPPLQLLLSKLTSDLTYIDTSYFPQPSDLSFSHYTKEMVELQLSDLTINAFCVCVWTPGDGEPKKHCKPYGRGGRECGSSNKCLVHGGVIEAVGEGGVGHRYVRVKVRCGTMVVLNGGA